jgi:hypothetical protein
LFGLSNAMCPVFGLFVILRVKIHVLDDHSVSCSQIDP